MALRISPLTPTEITQLKKVIAYDRRARWRVRAQILLAAHKGAFSPQIASTVKCHPSTVRRWIKRWNQNRFQAFRAAARHADQTKTQARCAALEKVIQCNPIKAKLPFTRWTCRTISAFIRDQLSLPWTPQRVWYYLKKAGLRHRKVVKRFVWKPVEYTVWPGFKRFLDYCTTPDILVLFLDEKGPVSATRYGGYCWSSQIQSFDIRQQIHGKIHLFGAYDPRTRQIRLISMDGKNSGEFCDAFSRMWIELDQQRWKLIVIIMDNASYHKSKYTTQFLARFPRLLVEYLPPYSPEFNPIEQCFRHYSKEVLECGTFSSVEELYQATTNWEQYFNGLRQEIFPRGGEKQVFT